MQGSSCAIASLRESRSLGLMPCLQLAAAQALLMMRDGLLQAVEDIEQETGAPLDADNEDGWSKLSSVAKVRSPTVSASCTC